MNTLQKNTVLHRECFTVCLSGTRISKKSFYFGIFRFQSMLVSRFVCLFVCMFVSTFWATILKLGFSFYYIILSGVRIEKDRILTKSVAFSHSYDHFSYSE